MDSASLRRYLAPWPVIRANIQQTLSYYLTALWGRGLRLDPEANRNGPVIGWRWKLAVILGAAILTDVHSRAIVIGAVLFLLSPLWIYTLANLSDPVFDYRAYLAVAGWALILTKLPPWILVPLILLWAVQSLYRSRYFRSDLDFWRQVERENNSHLPERRAHNPGLAFWDVGNNREALRSFNAALTHWPESRKLNIYRQGCAVEQMIQKAQAAGK